MIFGTIKEGIIEILDEHLDTFRTEMVAMVGARSLTFREFRVCGAPKFFRTKGPIASRWCLADISNAFRTSFRPKGPGARFALCLLEDRALNWWEGVDYAFGGSDVETMS